MTIIFPFAMFKQGKGLKRDIPAYFLQLFAYLPQLCPAIPPARGDRAEMEELPADSGVFAGPPEPSSEI